MGLPDSPEEWSVYKGDPDKTVLLDAIGDLVRYREFFAVATIRDQPNEAAWLDKVAKDTIAFIRAEIDRMYPKSDKGTEK